MHLLTEDLDLDGKYEDESPDPDEEFMDMEQKKLTHIKLNFPLMEEDITRLLEVFKKRRVSYTISKML